MYWFLPTALRLLLASLLAPKDAEIIDVTSPPPLRFSLRHNSAVSDGTRIVLSNVPPSLAPTTFAVDTQYISVQRPSSLSLHPKASVRSIMDPQRWDDMDMIGPNVEHRETLLQLAKMTFDAYAPGPDNKSEWYDLGHHWNTSYPFGWEPDADGFRGQIFVSDDESTVIVSVKGTSAAWLVGGGGPTTRKDKLNDNLLFSCCCARVGPTWSGVCDCHTGGYTCDQNCLERSLTDETLFYSIGANLYNNLTYMYPHSNIWFIGHSLGGALASLLGVTFGVPVVAFEAPGEKLAAARLHLPSPPSTQHVTHVFHTADPVAMGICNGVTSSCALGGYAMESRCHLGKVMRYDTVGKLGWSVDVRTHLIKVVIEKVLSEDWASEEGRQVPFGEPEEEDCVDCFSWEFGQFKNASL